MIPNKQLAEKNKTFHRGVGVTNTVYFQSYIPLCLTHWTFLWSAIVLTVLPFALKNLSLKPFPQTTYLLFVLGFFCCFSWPLVPDVNTLSQHISAPLCCSPSVVSNSTSSPCCFAAFIAAPQHPLTCAQALCICNTTSAQYFSLTLVSFIFLLSHPFLSPPLPPCCFFLHGLRCLGHSELLKKASPCTGLCGLVYTAHYSQYKRLNKHACTISDISTVGEWVWTHLKGVRRLVKVTDCPHVWHFTNSAGLFSGKKQDTSHLLTQSNKDCFRASHNSGVSLTQQMHMTRTISSYIILCWGSINCCLCMSAWGYAGVMQVFTGHRRKWVMLSSDRLSAALTPRYFFPKNYLHIFYSKSAVWEGFH